MGSLPSCDSMNWTVVKSSNVEKNAKDESPDLCVFFAIVNLLLSNKFPHGLFNRTEWEDFEVNNCVRGLEAILAIKMA